MNSFCHAINIADESIVGLQCDSTGKLLVNIDNHTSDYATEPTLNDVKTACNDINNKLTDGSALVSVVGGMTYVTEIGSILNPVTVMNKSKNFPNNSNLITNGTLAGGAYQGFAVNSWFNQTNTLISYTDSNVSDTTPILVFTHNAGDPYNPIYRRFLGAIQPVVFSATESLRYAALTINLEYVTGIQFYNPSGVTLNNIYLSLHSSTYI